MARLYLESLLTKLTRRRIKGALNKLPDGLDETYDDAIARINAQNRDYAQMAMFTLNWIFCSARPLSFSELQTALAIEPEDKELDIDGLPSRQVLLSVCAGIVVYNEETDVVSLVHYTLQEYFDRKSREVFAEAHSQIALTCLTLLLFDEYEDMDCSNSDTAVTLLRSSPLLSYAVQYWGFHTRKSSYSSNIEEQAMALLRDQRRVDLTCYLMETDDGVLSGNKRNPAQRVQGLSLAAYFGLAGAIGRLIDPAKSLNASDSRGWSALHWAVAGGQPRATMALLSSGADTCAKDLLGWTPLHRAATLEQSEVASILLTQGAELNSLDGYGGTPLYRAAESGSTVVAKTLLERGAETEHVNSYNQTALHRAAAGGHIEIVQALLARGAKAAPRDHWGYTPQYLATDNEHDQVAQILCNSSRRNARRSAISTANSVSMCLVDGNTQASTQSSDSV